MNMKQICMGLFLILVMMGCGTPGEPGTTFILVRHAEKASDGTQDPDLTDEGRARAERLHFMLKDTPLTAVYSTNFKRTRSTVSAVAEEQGLDVRSYEPLKQEVIASILEEHRGGTVLIAGHTNTTPWTANLLIGKETYKEYPETEYGIILVVTVTKLGVPASVVRVNY